MAGKVTKMSKIKQLIQLHETGVSNRRIAKALSLDRETVNTYVRKLKAGNMQTAELLELDAPVLESKFMAGTAAYTDKRFEAFKEMLPYFEKELARKHVTRSILSQACYPQYSMAGVFIKKSGGLPLYPVLLSSYPTVGSSPSIGCTDASGRRKTVR